MGRISAQLTAAGVGLESIEFYGSFEYRDTLTNDLDLGYSDVDMIQGGTLGGIYEPENDPDFPI